MGEAGRRFHQPPLLVDVQHFKLFLIYMKQLTAKKKALDSAFKVHNYLLCCAIRSVLICIHPEAHEDN